jgi:signal transduction histidine kinase
LGGAETIPSSARKFGPPALRADARAIQYILVNLLSDALKFTGDGGRISVIGGVDAAGDYLLATAGAPNAGTTITLRFPAARVLAAEQNVVGATGA